MSDDPGSLQNLQDIVEAPRVAWWPLAPGWWIVLAVVIAAALALSVWSLLRWRQNAYRRQALRELRSATSSLHVAQLLKRTALAKYGRTDVAALSGEQWVRWLERTSHRKVPGAVRSELARGLFCENSSKPSEALYEYAETWIRCHEETDRC